MPALKPRPGAAAAKPQDAARTGAYLCTSEACRHGFYRRTTSDEKVFCPRCKSACLPFEGGPREPPPPAPAGPETDKDQIARLKRENRWFREVAHAAEKEMETAGAKTAELERRLAGAEEELKKRDLMVAATTKRLQDAESAAARAAPSDKLERAEAENRVLRDRIAELDARIASLVVELEKAKAARAPGEDARPPAAASAPLDPSRTDDANAKEATG